MMYGGREFWGQRTVEEQQHVAHGTPHAQLTPHYTSHYLHTSHNTPHITTHTHTSHHISHNTPFPHNPVSNGVCVAPATGSRAARPRPGSGCAPGCSRSHQPQQCTGECGPGRKRTSAQGDNSGVQITLQQCGVCLPCVPLRKPLNGKWRWNTVNTHTPPLPSLTLPHPHPPTFL